MDQVSFKVTAADRKLIARIVDRAMRYCKENRIKYEALDCDMDITACHANGNKLDLLKLLGADDFNFAHDVFGIRRHLDRDTGKLLNCFLPRCHAMTKRDKRIAA